MRSLNRVLLIGNLGSDPEVRQVSGGQTVASFNLATNESWGGRDGQPRQERTEWHRIVLWGRLAEIAGEYLRKGRQVYLEGRLQTRQWQDQQGQKRYTTEVVAQNMILLGGRGAEGAEGAPMPRGAGAGAGTGAGAVAGAGGGRGPDFGGPPTGEPGGDPNAGGADFFEDENDLPF